MEFKENIYPYTVCKYNSGSSTYYLAELASKPHYLIWETLGTRKAQAGVLLLNQNIWEEQGYNIDIHLGDQTKYTLVKFLWFSKT